MSQNIIFIHRCNFLENRLRYTGAMENSTHKIISSEPIVGEVATCGIPASPTVGFFNMENMNNRIFEIVFTRPKYLEGKIRAGIVYDDGQIDTYIIEQKEIELVAKLLQTYGNSS